MNYHFDVVFFDNTANKYYDRMTLEKQPLGGSEASVVRVAEGLASLGLKVCVMQGNCNKFEPVMGQHCFFMHAEDLNKVSCKHYIQIRVNSNPQLFPKAKHYLWLHDVTQKSEHPQDNSLRVVAVSHWHKQNILDNTDYTDIKVIYNPVPEELYNMRQVTNPKMLVWMSSPHKGLDKALQLFKTIHEKDPSMQFHVFNPGYIGMDNITVASQPGIVLYGPQACRTVWNVVGKANAVFYPTDWKETFGCIAAEANAMGVPVLTRRLAALAESVSSPEQFAETDQEFIEKALAWADGQRPAVKGQEEFKFNQVILEWVKYLAG